jgi:hypothetical protein
MANTKVYGEQIVDGSITAAKLADGTIVAAELANNAVETAAINADAVTGAKIADDAIDSEHYVDGSIDTAHIANDQVTQAKIADDAVGADQLAASAVVTASIVDDNVTTAKIADGNISTALLADNAVTSAKLANNIDIAGTFDVTGATTLDAGLTVDTTTLVVDASNNRVGIGTASPSYPLSVELDASATWLSRFYNTGTTESDNGLLVRTGSEHDGTITLGAYSGSSYKFVVLGDGNVGIGTTSPSAPLHVTRTASGYPILKLTQNGADQYNTIYLQNSDSTAATVVMGTGGGSVGNASWANGAVFGTTSDAKVVLLQNDSAAVTIDTDQKVGIGTDDPLVQLDVRNGSIMAGSASETTGSLTLQNYYSGDHHLATMGTNHSSGGWYFGYGVKQQGSGTTQSTFSNFSGKRSFAQLFGDRMQFSFAAAQNTAIGTGVSGLSEKVRISEYGVAFNGDTAEANSLNDYEEGTWTPSIRGTTGSAGTHAESTSGSGNNYTKIGNRVYFQMSRYVTNKGSFTGKTKVTGLPFTNNGSTATIALSLFPDADYPDTRMVVAQVTGNSEIQFYDGARADIQHDWSDLGTGYYLNCAGYYLTDS